MATAEINGLDFEVSDVSGERVVNINGVPADASVGEVVQGLLAEMSLPTTDVEGRPLTYHARLEREGRHLHASETVGDALRAADRLVLQPNITAGAGDT